MKYKGKNISFFYFSFVGLCIFFCILMGYIISSGGFVFCKIIVFVILFGVICKKGYIKKMRNCIFVIFKKLFKLLDIYLMLIYF